jgi:hypothetical protein
MAHAFLRFDEPKAQTDGESAPRAGPRWHLHGPADEADRKPLTPRVREGDVQIPEDLGAERVVL